MCEWALSDAGTDWESRGVQSRMETIEPEFVELRAGVVASMQSRHTGSSVATVAREWGGIGAQISMRWAPAAGACGRRA